MIAAGGRVSARAEKSVRAWEAEGQAAGQCFFWYFSLRQRKVHIKKTDAQAGQAVKRLHYTGPFEFTGPRPPPG